MDISKINKFPSFDEGFPKRVIKTSVILAVIFIIYSFFINSLPVTLGLAIGEAISIFSIKALLWILDSYFKPNAVIANKGSIKRIVTLAGIVKIIFIGAVLFFVFRYITINFIALFIGVSIVQIVIVFKILGLLFVNYLNKSDETASGLVD